MAIKFDFGGYATKNDLKCRDGLTIRKDAFKECDGVEVPLVWSHRHGSPSDVLGHAVLENRDDGVYAYGVFNNTESGKNAKELVKNGDVKALSIYANDLVKKASDVVHGMIREVSLCLAGANPGARIEALSIEHSDDDDTDIMDALVFNGNNIELAHSDDDKEKKEEEPKEEAEAEAKGEAKAENKEEKPMAENSEKTVKDVFDSLTDEQKDVVYFMIGQAIEQNEKKDEEEPEVAHNVFEGDTYENSIAHAAMIDEAMSTVIKDGKKYGTLRDSLEHHMEEGGALAHTIDTTGMTVPSVSNSSYATNVGYGINGVEMLYPESKTLNAIPEFIKRDTDWVDVVLNGVHTSPFARVKSIYANITEDEARAKGYIKGTQKKNEFFSMMKRETLPQTIYKKQKFDRDDIVDITDMNVVAWIKGEMKLMLNEEKARAILIGDGRDVSDSDKINEQNIRPIVSDVNLFTIKVTVPVGADDEATAKNLIKSNLKARKNYKGSGNPIMFTTEDWLTNMLLAEDSIGRRLYATEAELASANRVRSIVTVPAMEGYKNSSNQDLMAIIVNLNDYNVGADKGGEVNMFDDFNIDYNQFIYLIETRCSGALTKPYSAIALFKAAAANSGSGSDSNSEESGT